MEGQGNATNASNRRWTCEACGCNTNSESDRTCSICGTSNGPSLLRRAGYAARSGLFARSFAARRGIMNDEIGIEGDELWERVVDGVEIGGDEDEQAIAALAMEVAGVSGSASARDSNRQRFMDAARSLTMATRENQRPDPDELLRAANANSSLYQPKWVNPSQIGGRMRTGNGIEVGEGENQNIAHLPLGAGEGRALRALESFPRSAPFASFNLSSPNSGPERRPRRAFGFRVAFEHPMKGAGSGMGGCYLVGVTTTSFAAFGERNGLQQSPFFWGIEDGGSKYEGSRNSHSSRSSRRGQSNYAVELSPSEATRNADNVLFGSREVVTCVVDFESRTLTFWRDDELIGTLVSNLPRGGNLYPVVVPFNSGATVAITGMDGNPLPLLRAFATDWKQAQHEKDIQRRKKLISQRSLLIRNGRPTQELIQVLRTIFSWYATDQQLQNPDVVLLLNRVQASRLWYRCGMKLSCLDTIFEAKTPASDKVSVEDFLELACRVIREEEDSPNFAAHHQNDSVSFCEIGDKVELVEGYERFGDAANGPLGPGDRGTVVELQEGPDGERRSVRVLYNSRRWWYQPQALLPERSGLTESPGVWFLRTILRAHGYDHTTLQPLWGKPLSTSSWQVGDIVVPKQKSSEGDTDHLAENQSDDMQSCVGRIVAESSSSTSSLTARGRDSGTVLVEFVGKAFAEGTGVQTGTGLQVSGCSVETRRVRVSRLVHSNVFHEANAAVAPSFGNNNLARFESQDDSMETETSIDCTVSDKVLTSIKKIRRLDVAAIETVTKECRKNTAALASTFAAGLPEAVMTAVDYAENKLSLSEDGEGLSQAISALGRLAVVVAEQLFPNERGEVSDGFVVVESSTNPESASPGDSHRVREDERLNEIDRRMNIRRYIRNDEQQPRASRLSDSAVMQDVSRTGRPSSLQQRRTMLLALMSRARRNNSGSLNEFGNRETGSREAGIGNMMPPLGPFRPHDAAALLFPRGEMPHGGNWDGISGISNQRDEDRTDAGNSTSASGNGNAAQAPRGSSNSQGAREASILELILRGRGRKPTAQAGGGKPPASTQSASLRALVSNGLLRDSLVWVKAASESHSKRMSSKPSQRAVPCLQTATDEEGMSLLLLAISFGCSSAILKHIIKMGAPVGEKEIELAARTDQPEALSILLHCAVYSEGMVDLQTCSPEIVRVIREASGRQEGEELKMREHGGAFIIKLLRKFLHLGLASRHKKSATDVCSRSIAGALVGNVLLKALLTKQKHALSASRESDRSKGANQSHDQSDVSNRGRYTVEGAYSALSSTPQGLLCVLPKETMGKSLLDDVSHVSTFFMLVEDYLCSKDINDGAIGLTLLSILLKLFPIFSLSSEIERYGFRELVTSHDAFASNRLAEISSRVAAKASASSDESSVVEALATSGVVLCPKQHAAALHVTKHSSYRCDLCGKGVERGRIMHGCRECDWDACERCTDKAEGGIVKWNHIRELASECQRLLRHTNCTEQHLEATDIWAKKAVESLVAADNSSEVNNLSIRLLQRDCESIKELSSILSARGRLTVHQFLTVILPALHSSLLGRSLDNGRLNVSQTGFNRRNKKPRVIGSSSRDVEDALNSHLSDDRLSFCKAVVRHLVKEPSEKDSNGDKQQSFVLDEKLRQENSDEEDDGSDQGSDDDDENDNLESERASAARVPELLRRLHQVLSLYENVTSPQHFHPRGASSGFKGGDLQSLTKPLQIRLSPAVSRKRQNLARLRQHLTSIFVEPLMSVSDLERHVLRACRISHPKYVTFCRRLATERAIIFEQPPARRRTGGFNHKWRVARVLGYDEESGWHTVQYASGLRGSRGTKIDRLELKRNNLAALDLLQFDENESRLMLSARNYSIICRHSAADEAEGKSPFDMEHLLTDGIVSEADDHDMTSSPRPSVGARVESNFGSSNWQAYTVVATYSGAKDPGQKDDSGFVLVSDAGEVHCGVPSKQIRGLDLSEASADDSSGAERAGRSFGASRSRDGRGHRGRTFPFLTGRRQASDGSRTHSSGTGGSSLAVLKRTWSALSPIESMCPIEVDRTDASTPEYTSDVSHRGLLFRCKIGSEIEIFVDRSVIELPPKLRVKFGFQESHAALELVSPGDTTLISLLWRLLQRDERQICNEQPYNLVYAVVCEERNCLNDIEPFKEQSSAGGNHVNSVRNVEFSTVPSSHASVSGDLLDGRPEDLFRSQENMKNATWPNSENRSRKLRQLTSFLNEEDNRYRGLCDGLDDICVQCMEIVGLLCEVAEVPSEPKERSNSSLSIFENAGLSKKLVEQLEDPLMVVGGALPEWCIIAPSFSPRVFSYDSRRLLLERAAFGVSRSTLRQQESKVNVGRLRQRMASLRARAVELVGEAFSGGAEDPTALQLQADELYGMEEALAARVKAAFRAERWEEHSLQVAKAAVHRDLLISDAAAVMNQYANDSRICRRRLEVRFDGESGFDAASGDEAGVTRGFYADVAEALLSCDIVAGVNCGPACLDVSTATFDKLVSKPSQAQGLPCRLPLWIPDVDASGQVIIPTPRADPHSGLGVYPRPLSRQHPQACEVFIQFRFMGRLFAAAMRDGFMFPLPLSSAFLKLVQHGNDMASLTMQAPSWKGMLVSSNQATPAIVNNESPVDDAGVNGAGRDILLNTFDLPRPGFLGGEVFAVDIHICRALDRLDELDPPLTRVELERGYKEVATDKNFARVALGKTYDCSFEDYFQDRTFVDPLDPTQGLEATPLCQNGHLKAVSIRNIREWVALAKDFVLHDGVIAQALAFRRGIEDFFSADYLRLFTPEELQSDVCGVGDNVDNWTDADVRKLFKLDGGKGAAEALVAVAAIGGEGGAVLSRRFGPSSPTINFVVKALLEATPKLRRQFLSFVTSVPIVTPGQIEVVPMVSPSGEFMPMRDPGCLPRANTCARRLYLPKFETYESFCQVLWAVVREESKFKGFYEWRGN